MIITTIIHKLLFANTTNNNTYYWLGSRCVSTYVGYSRFRIRYVGNGRVDADRLFSSEGIISSPNLGLRPVVYLKSNVKVTSDASLSM